MNLKKMKDKGYIFWGKKFSSKKRNLEKTIVLKFLTRNCLEMGLFEVFLLVETTFWYLDVYLKSKYLFGGKQFFSSKKRNLEKTIFLKFLTRKCLEMGPFVAFLLVGTFFWYLDVYLK